MYSDENKKLEIYIYVRTKSIILKTYKSLSEPIYIYIYIYIYKKNGKIFDGM